MLHFRSGPDPTKAIQQEVTAATVTFTALKNTPPGTPTLVTYTTNTQVLSIGPNDQASENVLSSATPATIAIGASSGSPTYSIPQGTPTPSPAISPSYAPTPTTSTISQAPTPTTAPTATPAISQTPTAIPSGPTVTPGGPTATPGPTACNSLTVDRSTTGIAPYSVTFTANGNSTSGTISKVSFNFGDGQVSDVTQAGGIGTASVNVQASHTYNNPGTYAASAVLTDNNNNVSSGSAICQQTITVNAASSSASTSNTTTVTNPTPTMPPTGSTGAAIGLGLGAMLLIVGGGLLFFIL